MFNTDFSTLFGFFIGAFLLSIIINRLLLKFVKTLGIRNENQQVIVRWSAQAKPALGGISFFIVFLASIIAYFIFFSNHPFSKTFVGVISVATLGFLMGLADDAYNTQPFFKFTVQLVSGVILIFTGNAIQIFDNIFLDYPLTVFWVVGMMNSINMLDNMDGITTSVSIVIVGASIFLFGLTHSLNTFYLIILIGLLGALLGFLIFNWHPSKMFMGDTGSQFLGVFLATLAIQLLWNGNDFYGNKIPSKQFLSVILFFAIPIIDTSTVSINRILKGKSPFVGGKDHTTHALSYLGYTDKAVAWLMLSLSAISALLGILVLSIRHWNIYYFLIFGGYFIALFFVLYGITHSKQFKAKVR